ncbi:YidB family protein [Caballeronia sordidicola]|nr:YidB family protein [Caballeronia sordidicola]
MSLLDTLASSFGKSSPEGGGAAPAGLVAIAMEFINNQPGGLTGLIQRFHENGAGDVVSSWIGHGENKPISSDTLTNVLGSGAVTDLAQKAGVSGDQLSGMLAAVLPHLVDKATPNGEVPADGKLDLTSVLGSLGGLGALGGLLGKGEEPKA